LYIPACVQKAKFESELAQLKQSCADEEEEVRYSVAVQDPIMA